MCWAVADPRGGGTQGTFPPLELSNFAGPAAMVRPVRPWPYRFRGRKNGVAWILTYACVIEWPLRAVNCSLGRINYGEVFFELFRVFKHPK